MIRTTRNSWIQAGATLAVVVALTAGTRPSAVAPAGDLLAELPRTAVGQAVAPGMVPVQMHDLQETQLMGVRERIVLPDNDGLLRQMEANTPGGAIPPMSMPTMPQPHRDGLDRSLQLDGDIGESPTGADGLSWGWLADDVNSAAPPAPLEPETGGFGFAPATGSRRYEDRNNRLGSDQGFGTGGNDAFIFQRRRDDRFSE